MQPYFTYAMPIWASNHSSIGFDSLFKLQKKAIRIVTNKTTKIDNKFQHTKPLFKKSYILTIQNLYYYLTACEAKKLLFSEKPTAVFKLYQISSRSSLLIMPKFKKEFNKSNSFVFNSSKIINFLTANNINYSSCSLKTFKTNVKRLLMSRQAISLKNDTNWLPNNNFLFSDVKMG